MTSRIAVPSSGKTDQRKVYTDWANNRLKKAGLTNVQVSDLQKDIPDGYILPKIIQAVVHEEVPGILSSPDNEDECKQNVEASVVFLQRIGINCSGFSAKDISDGSMRAILQLFFSLSQFKPKASDEAQPSPPNTSRLRPISPSLRMMHSVRPEGSKLKSPHMINSINSSPSTSNSSSVNTSPVSTPVSVTPPTGVPSFPPPTNNNGKQAQARRHAGSIIPTSLDPMGQVRRIPYRSITVPSVGGAGGGAGEERQRSNSSTVPPQATPASTQATPTNMPRPTALQPPKTIGGVTGGGALKSPMGSLKSPTDISAESAADDIKVLSSSSVATATRLGRSNSSITESSSPGLRKKLSMPSGRATPTLTGGDKSGLARPTRLQKLTKPTEDTKSVISEGIKRSNTIDNTSRSSSKEPSPASDLTGGEERGGGGGGGASGTVNTKLARPSVTGDNKTEDGAQQFDKSGASKLQKLTQLPSKLKAPAPSGGHAPSKDGEENAETATSGNRTGSIPVGVTGSSKLSMLTRKPVGTHKVSQLRKPNQPSSLLSNLTSKDNDESVKVPSAIKDEEQETSETTPTSQETTPTPQETTPTHKQATPTHQQVTPTHQQVTPTHQQSSPVRRQVPKQSETTPTKDPKPHPSIPPLSLRPEILETTPTKNDTTPTKRGNDQHSSSSSINSETSSTGVGGVGGGAETPSPFGGRKYVRRTSPEGMSVDETISPSDSGRGLDKETYSSPNKENIEAPPTSVPVVKRAHSLSPKASRRIFTSPPPSSVQSSDNDEVAKQPNRGILHSRKQGDSPAHSADKHSRHAPHSSSNESFSSSEVSLGHVTSGESLTRIIPSQAPPPSLMLGERRISNSDRPRSLENIEKHTFNTGSYPGDLQSVSTGGLIRRGSTRSDRLDYSDVESFLETGLHDRNESSTPELLETYENQLSHLKKDLESKARMLTMYETSMADLSTKVTTLKRSLEEKDAAIKHLTEERIRWQDIPFDSHSLAPSRLAVMPPTDTGALSDGGLSDGGGGGGGGDNEKDNTTTRKRKDKKWRFSLRQKRNRSKKDQQDINQLEVASLAGSIASSGRPLKRTGTIGGGGGSSRKPSDLISISEYETRTVRDYDTKSIDAQSEYYGGPPVMEDLLSIYEDIGDGIKVIVELLKNDTQAAHDNSVETITLGTISIPQDCSWVLMDNKICDIFQHHINAIDPDQYLHLTDDSILYYMFDDVKRSIGNALLPFTTPHQAATNDDHITIALKGVAQESCDALAYKYLVSVDVLQSYISLLLETQWIVVMGTKGTCKTSIAEGLLSYLELYVEGEEAEEGVELMIDEAEDNKVIKRFSVSSSPGLMGGGIDSVLKYMREELPLKLQRSKTPILLFDNIYDCQSLEQVLSAAGTLSKRPYIVATLCSGSTRGIPLHQLMLRHNIRVVTCNTHNEPIIGMLSRTLRKKVYQLKADPNFEVEPVAEQLLLWLPYLLDHLNFFISKFHSNNVALGPRVFLNCPLETSSVDMELWFINLWNHFIIPYLMGTIMAGIETYSADPTLDWIDVREWVIETYPWPSTINVSKLKTLTPEDVGWNHAVRPQNQSRYMSYMRDDDVQSVLRMQN